MLPNAIVEEDAKLEAMQRIWQIRRGLTSSDLFENIEDTKDILRRQQQAIPQHEKEIFENVNEIKSDYLTLNASKLGDFPAVYKIPNIDKHQLPVIGVYCDPKIIPGFRYRVRPLSKIGEDKKNENKCLFNNRALNLLSIGRGYTKRFTFEPDQNKLINNENYFWSDNRQEGYVFELEIVKEGDKFTIYNLNNEPQGTLEILKTEGNQIEIDNKINNYVIEKKIDVQFIGKVEFYETGVAKPTPISGTVICLKKKNKNEAEILKINNIVIKKCKYYLKPGVDIINRRVTVKGIDINDIPTQYTMTGLLNHEIPVVGTYVDPRIIPGFYYRIRPNDRKTHLFDGKTLKLTNIGIGYAKKLTFESKSNDSYLWSDNHPDGLGLEPRAVHEGMKFKIYLNKEILGEAKVFKTDKPQIEEKMERILTDDGIAIEKSIHVDILCDVKLITSDTQYSMRIYGLAIVRKNKNSLNSKLLRIEKIGLDSDLEILFKQMHTELIFLP